MSPPSGTTADSILYPLGKVAITFIFSMPMREPMPVKTVWLCDSNVKESSLTFRTFAISSEPPSLKMAQVVLEFTCLKTVFAPVDYAFSHASLVTTVPEESLNLKV